MTNIRLSQIVAIAVLMFMLLASSAAADEPPVRFQYCAGEVDSMELEYFSMIERYKSIGGLKSEEVLSYSGSSIWVYSTDVAIYGDYLYVLNANGLQIFDITDRTSPILLKEIHLEFGSPYTHLCIDGTYLYVPTSDRLRIFDLTDPLNPLELGIIIFDGFIHRVKVIGNRAYVGIGRYSGEYTETPAFYILDITDKTSPSIIGKYHSPSYYEDAREFVIDGDYVYTANHWSDRVEIISIVDETSPVYVGYVSINNALSMGYRNGYLYVGGSDLFVLDATVPGELSLIHTYDTKTIYALGIHDNILYGMEYMDPLTHAYGFVGDWELDSISTHTSRGSRFSLEFDGDHMFMGEGLWGWSIADISDPANIPRVGEFSHDASSLMGLAVKDDIAYVTNNQNYFEGDSSMSRNGIYVIDATDKENPVFVEYENKSGSSDAHIYDTLLIISSCPQAQLFSLANPLDPVYLSRYPMEGDGFSYASVARGTNLYVCGGGYGFNIASIADPSNPVHLSTIRGPGFWDASMSVVLKSNLAYDVEWVMGGGLDSLCLMTIDVSDPSDPVIVDYLLLREHGIEGFPGYPLIVERNDYLYIFAFVQGMHIVDISNPVLPDLVNTYAPENARYFHAAFKRDYLFLAANSSIEVLDISNPFDPQMVQFIPLPTSAQRVVVEGNYLHVAIQSGYYLYEINLPPVECGDVNWSGGVDIDDVVHLITYIFAGGLPPDPLESGDVDSSGGIDIDDVVYLINYIFGGGPAPCEG